MMPEIIEIGIEMFLRGVEGYCLWLLLDKFGDARREKKRLNCIFTVLAWVFLGKAASMLAFRGASAALANNIVCFILRVCAVYGIGLAFYRMGQGIRLFLVLLFFSFDYGTIQIGKGTGAFFLYVTNQLAMRIDAMNQPELIHFLIAMIYVAEDFLVLVMLLFSARFIVKNYKQKLNAKSVKEMASYMLPVVLGGLASVMLYFTILLINENENFIDYEVLWGSHILVMVVALAIWLAVLYSFRLQQELAVLQEERVQKSVLENQILQMQNSMSEMEQYYEGIRRVKHDMKNQMAALQGMLKETKETENGVISQYVEDMQKTMQYLEQKIHTGNAVSDAVIGSKFHYAAKEIEGIRLEEEFLLTDKPDVRAYDIGIILNNGLDNAIEACKKQRGKYPEQEQYIKVRSFWRQKMFFIEIENSFEGVLVRDADGYPYSEKSDGDVHGIGLKNIRHCALKYNGEMECIAKNGKFILSVMLKGGQKDGNGN